MKGKTILAILYIIFTIFSIIFIDISKDDSGIVLFISSISITINIFLNTFLACKLIEYLTDNYNNKVI